MTDENSTRFSKVTTRLASITALILLGAAGIAVARAGYRLWSDSFVAPITLSPDSEIVINSNLRLNELYAERAKMVAEQERLNAELSASDSAIQQLTELRQLTEGALSFVQGRAQEALRTGKQDLKELAERERKLLEMHEAQSAFVAEMSQSVEDGLVKRSDHLREQLSLSQLELAKVDTARARLETKLRLDNATRALGAMSDVRTVAAAPELIEHRSQAVHLGLEILRLTAEQRAARARLSVAEQEIAKIDELTAQMLSRPIYRAIRQELDVAFVPYTQLEGIEVGAEVNECLWGIAFCEPVGRVTELLPGEVIMPDPWGAQARGRYAVLRLDDVDAAKAKVLRVRNRSTNSDTAQAQAAAVR